MNSTFGFVFLSSASKRLTSSAGIPLSASPYRPSTGVLMRATRLNASTPGASGYVRLTWPYHGTAAATPGYSALPGSVSAPPPQKPVTPRRRARVVRRDHRPAHVQLDVTRRDSLRVGDDRLRQRDPGGEDATHRRVRAELQDFPAAERIGHWGLLCSGVREPGILCRWPEKGA